MNQSPIVFSLFGNEALTKSICENMGYKIGSINIHTFPDEETGIKITTPVKDKDVIFVANLVHPNSKILPLIFAAETARALGAQKITLIAPYLPYMRQDIQFHPGESITSQYFSKLISHYFDKLITVDPHLHRVHALSEIYSIPAIALHATDCIGEWIKTNVPNGILIGPDEESSQWVSQIAHSINKPFIILEKMRYDDHHVTVSAPNIDKYQSYSPILVDDIISTAVTMIETIHHLKVLNMKPPICIGVHALFSGQAYEALLLSGAQQVVSCNTIDHVSNQINIANLIATALS